MIFIAVDLDLLLLWVMIFIAVDLDLLLLWVMIFIAVGLDLYCRGYAMPSQEMPLKDYPQTCLGNECSKYTNI
jgi:hypothetical protein